MKENISTIYSSLRAIYAKHRRNHRGNPDSKQMCCMWSTDDPPDIIEGTEPICDMEDAFDIQISDEDAFHLYDMNLDQAAQKILELRNQKCQ